MKKISKALIVFITLSGSFCLTAKASTVSATISSATAVRFTDALLLGPHESLTYSLTGTATGQALIEKSNNASNWIPTEVSVNATGNPSTTGKLYSDSQTSYFRIRVTTITAGTSGSFILTMYDNDDVVQEFKNNKGIPIVVISDDSMAISGGFTASVATITTINSTGGTETNPTFSGAITVTSGSTVTITSSKLAGTITNVATTTNSGAVFNGTRTDNSTTTYNGALLNGTKTDDSTTTYTANSNTFNGGTFTNPSLAGAIATAAASTTTVNGKFDLQGEIFLDSVAALPTDKDTYVGILKTQSTGAAPFNSAGSLILRPRVSATAGRSSVYIYTGSPSAQRLKIDETGQIFTSSGGAVSIVASTSGALGIRGTSTNDTATAGFYGQTSSTVTTSTVSFGSTGVWSDFVSTSVAAGDYLMSAVLYAAANGGTITNINLGISQTSGNSTTGLSKGDSWVATPGPTAASDTSISIPALRVSLSAATTIYLKGMAAYSIATPNAMTRLSLVRIR